MRPAHLTLVISAVSLVVGSLAFARAQTSTQIWSYSVGTPIGSSPAVGLDGSVYIAAAGSLFAITNKGSVASNKWSAPIRYQCSSPTVAADGTIYVAAMDSGTPSTGYLYAFTSGGSNKWSYYIQGNGSPALGSDQTVYVQGNGLYAVSAQGTPKWNAAIGGQVTFGSPALSSDGTIYISSPDVGSFSAFNPDGTLKWSTSANIGRGESPAIGGDGTIYLVGSGLFAYLPNGTNLWAHQGPLYAAPALAQDGTIYVAGATAFGFEYGLSMSAYTPDGTLKWQVQTNLGGGPSLAQTIGTPAVDSAGIIHMVAFNTLFSLSPGGTVLWAFTPGDGTTSLTSPTIGPDGTIYATFGSTLYAFSGTNALGRTYWPMYHQNSRHTGKVERPLLKQPQKRSDANFQFELYPQELGLSYEIDFSTNFNTWTSLTSIVATTLPTDVADLTATNTAFRFYRAVSSP